MKKDSRNKFLQIRVNDEEFKLIKATAEHNGFSSVSDFVRAAALVKSNYEKLPTSKFVDVLYNNRDEEV